MLLYAVTAAGATMALLSSGKESYTEPSAYVPWVLVVVALVLVTMAVRAMSPIINVLIAAAILWYVWKTPTVKTMAQNALQEISSMMPKQSPAPPPPPPAT